MINGINRLTHWALTSIPTVHDEEALTALELMGRIGAKINEVITVVEQQTTFLEGETERIREQTDDIAREVITGETMTEYLNDTLLAALRLDLAELESRLDSLIVSEGSDSSSEVVDARATNSGIVYPNLGAHMRALGNGGAFTDAVRPGTVKAGRLSAGMLTGELRDKYTIREYTPQAGHWNESGYVDTLGDVTAHDGYKITDFIPCEYGDVFLLKTYIFGTSVRAAALYDEDKTFIKLAGSLGVDSWSTISDEIHIDAGTVRYVRFICGSGYVSSFEALRVTPRQALDRDAYGNAKGYIHARAKKRTDTITDRAQVKCSFRLPEGRAEGDLYRIPLQLLKWSNLEGYTFRLFGSTSATTYDMQLSTSASAYKISPAQGINPYFTVPMATAEGEPITHVALFIDLYPARPDEHINVYLPPLTLESSQGNAQGVGYDLHGAVTGDTINIVPAGAAGTHLMDKRILGIGDSLMAGNTLPKGASWFNLAAGAADMLHYNAAVNGMPISGADSMVSNIDAYLTAFPAPDYVIIQGGANDLRLNRSLTQFREGLTTIIQRIRAHAPECRIMLMTNWRRSDYINPLGLTEQDYVVEMLAIGEELCIPTVNNWTCAINLTDPAVAAWADEGMVSTGTANIHFSRKANEIIAAQTLHRLEGL